jgi:hypothetical protein
MPVRWTVAGLAALAVVAVGTAPAQEPTGILLVQDGTRGSLVAEGGGRFLLELRGVDRTTLWFADRPARSTGRIDTAFATRRVLDSDGGRPNAALELPEAQGSALTLPLQILSGRYLPERRTLRYRVRLLPRLADGGPARLAPSGAADRDPPTTFGPAQLFIDDIFTPQCQTTVINGTGRTFVVARRTKRSSDSWKWGPADGPLAAGARTSWATTAESFRGCSSGVDLAEQGFPGTSFSLKTSRNIGEDPTFACRAPFGFLCRAVFVNREDGDASVVWSIEVAS